MNTELMHEQAYIEMEAARIDFAEKYFKARPQIDNNDRRKVFESGFDRGYQAALNSQAKSVLEEDKLIEKLVEAKDYKTALKIANRTAPQPPQEDRVRELYGDLWKAKWVLKQIADLVHGEDTLGTAIFMARQAIAAMKEPNTLEGGG